MPDDNDRVAFLLHAGTELTGNAVGGAAGVLLAGPAGGVVGAAAGGAMGVVLAKGLGVITDVARRTLSEREGVRVGATAAFAITKIEQNLKAGNALRNDDFFVSKAKRRSDAEEIFEGVLLKSKNEHEEKKARLLANIFANVAFLPAVSAGEANHILQIAGTMTYRQMCTLALLQRRHAVPEIQLRDDPYRGWQGEITFETISVLQGIFQLYNFGLVACRNKDQEGYEALLGWTDAAPDRMIVTAIGERYCLVMGLNDVPHEDITEVARHLA